MSELVDSLISPWSLLMVWIVYGFAPGFVLRSLMKIYPKKHPRPKELIAELYTIPRLERPFFVAEQIETALFEAVPLRARSLGKAVRRARLRRHRVLERVVSSFSSVLFSAAFILSTSPTLIIGSYQYATSSGDFDKVVEARKNIIAAIILVVIPKTLIIYPVAYLLVGPVGVLATAIISIGVELLIVAVVMRLRRIQSRAPF